MKIACLGAGPAGLYFSILAKKADPASRVEVFERYPQDETVGWGIVFSDQALTSLRDADRETHDEIVAAFRHWDDIDIFLRGQHVRSRGHGFAGIARARLLDILRRRAIALSVNISYETTISEPSQWQGFDLVVAADGVHSAIRKRHAEAFRPSSSSGRCRFIWLSTSRKLDAFTFDFRETAFGWFTLHAYRYDEEASTVIIEVSEETWQKAGLHSCTTAQTVAFCEKLFADRLQGSPLVANPCHRSTSEWVTFEHILCEQWHHDNIVLIGDAAHTAHFSIGSGTRLAMEDAIALAKCIDEHPEVGSALECYQTLRQPEALKLVNAARNRMEWFESVARHACLSPLQFSYSLLTGSQRIGHESLRKRDPDYVASVERLVAVQSGVDKIIPPMFTPFRICALVLPNRIVVSPMAMYSAQDGVPGDFHVAHLAARALGGAGLVMTEATYGSPEGRITSGCTGLWNEEQLLAWRRIVDLVHAQSYAKVGLQLGHAGPKGATPIPGRHASGEKWPLLAASELPFDHGSQAPRAMTRADMSKVRGQLVAAVNRAEQAGFDLIELHCAHGYLFSSFISPLTNLRDDEYGGTLDNRLRYPLEVFVAMRAAWPASKPMFVRISAHDWASGGNTPKDAVTIAAAFKAAGADLIDVSSGQTTAMAKPVYGRMYQTPFADRIRNEVNIATMAVGNISEPDQVNSIIAAGRADLCALGRPHLADPCWTLHAAVALGYRRIPWPEQYESARKQYESHIAHFTGELLQSKYNQDHE